MENKISCSTIIAIGITLFALISLMHMCSTEDELAANFAKERTDVENAKKERTRIYKKQYNFNIDSIIPKIKQRKTSESTNQLKSPIIIYTQRKDEIYYDDSLNKSFPRSLTSFVRDSIKTIVLVQYEVNKVGYYSNNKTAAYRTIITIHFINMKTLKEVDNLFIYGDLPAQTTSYRHSAPEAEYGSEPSFNEIINSITSKLNK